jgi:hypothetical protein
MKSASVQDIKKELRARSQAEVVELCLRLARFKKENKELLTYLLFEAEDPAGYIRAVNEHISDMFAEIPASHNFYLKMKMIRKILRTVNRFVRYAGEERIEVPVRLHYLQQLRDAGMNFNQSAALQNLYDAQKLKLAKALVKLDEDLQYDYRDDLLKL